MGQWGLETCAGDSVYDYLDGVCVDVDSMKQRQANQVIKNVWAVNDEYSHFDRLGCVVFILTHGLRVDIDKIQQAIDYAKEELKNKNLDDWGDKEGRKAMVEKEIEEMEYAIKNGGKCNKRYIKGLFERLVEKFPDN